ncbi:hypothetical protein DVH05_026931 [Phytophthora capsici]|nr:hypothetical protein DVH05_026931 [Phytophthora capsici]
MIIMSAATFFATTSLPVPGITRSMTWNHVCMIGAANSPPQTIMRNVRAELSLTNLWPCWVDNSPKTLVFVLDSSFCAIRSPIPNNVAAVTTLVNNGASCSQK